MKIQGDYSVMSERPVEIILEHDPHLEIPADSEVKIRYTHGFFQKNGLYPWVEEFKLGTAGYRDTINMENFFSTDVPFNGHTIMIVAEAMARIYERRGYASIHLGGEVRRYTDQIIDLVGRIFASHGVTVHLNADATTTPIWGTSFGVFYNELDGGANITASHSQNFKQGFKPVDDKGMQLLGTAEKIQEEVKKIGKEASAGGLTLTLSRADSPKIRRDFHYLEAYSEYLRDIIPEEAFRLILEAQANGMKIGVSTVGGSMYENSLVVFDHFGIKKAPEGMIQYMHWEKRDDFHRVGEIDGENHGSDPTKQIIYRNIGLKEKLLSGEIDFGFIWDPDGDRYNIVTIADGMIRNRAEESGLEVETFQGRDGCIVYFNPNQIYFLNAALKLEMMAKTGELFEYDHIIGTTYPTSKSIGELGRVFNEKYAAEFARKRTRIRVFNTPVGFKYFGEMVGELERQIDQGGEVILEDATGREVSLGLNPRILIMAEESGGAAMGSLNWRLSKTGKRKSLAMKEKDGMQVAMMNLGIVSKLFLEGKSYAQLYIEKIEEYDIQFRYYSRIDKKLFDESLTGEAREKAKAIGNQAKDYMVETFKSLTKERSPENVRQALQTLVGDGAPIPEINRVFWAGDGTYIDFGPFWFELRASGTDAVLRFYIEGKDKALLSKVNAAFVGIADRKIRKLGSRAGQGFFLDRPAQIS
jgi:phosphomannomutase